MTMPARAWNWIVPVALLFGFASSVVTHYEPNTFLHGDGAFYANMNRSLLDGTLQQRDYQPASWYEDQLGWNHTMDQAWSNISLGGDGGLGIEAPTLMPIVATLFYLPLSYGGLLLFNVLALVLALTGAHRLASRYATPAVAAAVTLTVATLPIFTRNAYAYSNDVFYAALVIWAYELFFRGRIGLAGLLFGLSIWAKATNALLGLPLGVGLLAQRRWRDAAWLAGMTAAPVSVHLAMNAYMFGGPFTSAYNRVLVMEDGRKAIADVREVFDREFFEGLHDLWGNGYEGLAKNAWLLVPAVPAIALLWRRQRLLCLALGWGLLTYAGIFAPYKYTYARFFMPLALLLVAPAALLTVKSLGVADAALGIRRSRWAVVVGLLWLGLVSYERAPADVWTASDHIAEAKVTRGTGAQAMRCDYFNLRHMKWECLMMDHAFWQRWGLAVGSQCQFEYRATDTAENTPAVNANPGSDKTKSPKPLAGQGRRRLWLHPNPGVERKIVFRPPPGDLFIRYGLGNKSRYRWAKLQIRAGDGPAQTLQVDGIGKLYETTIAASTRGETLEIIVPNQPHDWRQLCVSVRVVAPH